MERTIDVSTNLSTQVPPDTIDVDITIRGTSKIREDCTAKYNVLLQTVKDALEKKRVTCFNSKKQQLFSIWSRGKPVQKR